MRPRMTDVQVGDVWVDRDNRSPFEVEVLAIVSGDEGEPSYVVVRRFSKTVRVRYDRFLKRFDFRRSLRNRRRVLPPEDQEPAR